MKLGPITKLDKRNLSTFKKFYDDFMWVCCDVTVTFYFMTNLEQSNLDAGFKKAWSVKLTLSLIVTFHLTKTENRT